MYLTFDKYESMHDDFDLESDFESLYPFLEKEVETKINRRTFNRFKNDTTYPEELLYCVSAMIDLLYMKRSTLESNTSLGVSETQPIVSQSNDGVSISYRKLSAENLLSSIDKELDRTIDNYLYGVRNSKNQLVLYRGIYSNE